MIRPRGSNCHATAPDPASWPPALVNIERTSAAVRLRLSVCGLDEDRHAARAVALVDDLLELLGLAAAGRACSIERLMLSGGMFTERAFSMASRSR